MRTGIIYDMFAHLSKEEFELMKFKYRTEQNIKAFIAAQVDKAIAKECETIESSEEWEFRNSVDEKEPA